MSRIEITPALLAKIEQMANRIGFYSCNEQDLWLINPQDRLQVIDQEKGEWIANCYVTDEANFIAAANPAVVLAMSKEIKRLWAAQCWAIVTIETGVVDGPYATFEDAENERLAELCDDPNEPMYRVEPWKGGA